MFKMFKNDLIFFSRRFKEHLKSRGIRKGTRQAEKQLSEFIENIANSYESSIESAFCEEKNETSLLRENISNKYGKKFDYADVLYHFSYNYVVWLEDKLQGRKDYNEKKYAAIRAIHASSCRIYQEILLLLKNGFSGGAFARYRSLYENMMSIAFINYGKDHVGEAFVNQLEGKNIDRLFWARSAFSNGKKVFFASQDEKQNSIMGWLKKEEIFKKALPHFKKFYEEASAYVHTDPTALFRPMELGEEEVFLVGPSGYGIDTVISRVVTMFAIIITVTASFYKCDESDFICTLVGVWIHKVL